MGVFCSETIAGHLGAVREAKESAGNEAGGGCYGKADDEGKGEAGCCCGSGQWWRSVWIIGDGGGDGFRHGVGFAVKMKMQWP